MRWLDGINSENGHELGQTMGDGEGQRGLVSQGFEQEILVTHTAAS